MLRRVKGEVEKDLPPKKETKLYIAMTEVQREWFAEWVARGQKDEGSCCLGIGISVYYLPPRARQPVRRQVIAWTWSQGDFEAERTKATPINRLAQYGAAAVYDCGRMD